MPNDRWISRSPERALRQLLLRLRSVFRKSQVEAELDEELSYHLERQIELNVANGMSHDDARDAARRRFGNVQLQKEQVRDTRQTRWLEESWGDVLFALRSLRRAKGFAAAVIVTLALGIGANTAMYTLLRGTLLRPLPHRDSDRLVYLRHATLGAGEPNVLFSVPEVAELRESSKTLIATAEYSSALPFTLVVDKSAPIRVKTGVVSGNFFDVLGLSPTLGRLTTSADDGAAAASVAVLSYRYWVEHFGGDSTVIGRTIRLNDRPSTIIGVVQEAPSYPRPTEIFVNTATSPHHLSASMATDRAHRMTELFARLAPHVTIDQARREVEQITQRMFVAYPEAYTTTARHVVSIASLKEALNERAELTFWLLMGAAGFVLLIACANVSNLTLIRGVRRERELVVRQALGAATSRLRRLLLAENLTLALGGGILGVLVAFAGVKLLIAFASQLSPRAQEIRVDGTVLAFGFLTSAIAAIALSFVPRLRAGRSLPTSLTPSGHRSTLEAGRKRLQNSLVVAQIAVSLVLLSGAGLLVRTIGNLQRVESGVRAENVLTVELPLDGDLLREVMKQPQNLARYEEMRDRISSLPGARVAAVGSDVPLEPTALDFDIKAEGVEAPPNETVPHGGIRTADPRFFEAAGIPLVSGRVFATTDRRDSPLVVVINRALAHQLFGDLDPVGRRVALTGPTLRFTPFSGDWRTVVGVVGDTHDRGLDDAPSPTLYAPFAQELVLGASLLVRTDAEPTALQLTVERAVRQVYPRQLIEKVRTLEAIRDKSIAPRRLNAVFIASFASLALLIAMVGIAGVLAFSVSARTAEIGIRMSLGAGKARIRQMVLREGGVLVATGLAVGLLGSLFAGRLLRGLLFGVTSYDIATLGAVALLLSIVGLLACWLPAARAAKVDPLEALRAD